MIDKVHYGKYELDIPKKMVAKTKEGKEILVNPLLESGAFKSVNKEKFITVVQTDKNKIKLIDKERIIKPRIKREDTPKLKENEFYTNEQIEDWRDTIYKKYYDEYHLRNLLEDFYEESKFCLNTEEQPNWAQIKLSHDIFMLNSKKEHEHFKKLCSSGDRKPICDYLISVIDQSPMNKLYAKLNSKEIDWRSLSKANESRRLNSLSSMKSLRDSIDMWFKFGEEL